MKDKVTVGFLLSPNKSWMGGVNYYSNLIGAVQRYCNADLKLLCFFGRKIESVYVENISTGVECVRTSLLDRYSILWSLWKITRFLTKSDWFVGLVLHKYSVQVFSHSGLREGRYFKTCNWIPDFQHIHLPCFFSDSEIASREKEFLEIANRSSLVFFSSNAALCDFRKKYSSDVKTTVLKFVSTPPELSPEETLPVEHLLNKYKLDRYFFYLPNQFWQHKNHSLVFRALSVLNSKGFRFQLVCSGNTQDYRRPEHYGNLLKELDVLGLVEQVKILGIIPYAHVYGLIEASSIVINPSLFEGWSSTVEECKTVGKRMLLSDIPVHREQYEEASFFDPYDSESLADLMLEHYFNSGESGSYTSQYTNVESRSKDFALVYERAISSLFELN